MSVLSALAKVTAARTGRAEPIADRRHYHLAERPLVLVPLRLAGEAAAPLAVALGSAPHDATVLIVAQPRDRVLRLRFIEHLADRVLPYISSFCENAEELTVKSTGEAYLRYLDAPQLLVPNPGGAEFLRLLGRSVRFHRTEGENAVPETLPLLGRWLTWFGDRSDFPGSNVCLAMTSMLTTHWASGQSALEDGNLAALLGWIDPPAGMTGPEAAALAEDPLAYPPAGPATDPGFDNEELAPLIAAYDSAEHEWAKVIAAERLEQALRGQLEPTWQLMWRAVELLRGLPEGASVEKRWTEDRGAFSWFAADIPEGYPQARRDSAVSATRRLLKQEQALDTFQAQRAFDDPRVLIEYRLVGEAFQGTISACEPERRAKPKSREVPRPYLWVHTADPFRARIGETLIRIDRPAQKAEVVAVDADVIQLELISGMGQGKNPAVGSVPEEGDAIGFARFSPGGFGGPPAKLPPREETPWTHGGPPPEPTSELTEEWS
ncbi:hypothetical protein [Nocardia jinanensis]|uniref:Uncharacterized protein n=1 Tax=Nocardia jinanensis TaxID=382504 RepID=A0A917VQY0_9NOCA|nr:hypothetical protein [Nocardia jinanensis]GGL05328.1 hypothetical protein GCM10011588_19830 [Nocardia jinanensis]